MTARGAGERLAIVLVLVSAGCGSASGADAMADPVMPRATPTASTPTGAADDDIFSDSSCDLPRSVLSQSEQDQCTADGFELRGDEGPAWDPSTVPTRGDSMFVASAKDAEVFLTALAGGSTADCVDAANGDLVCAWTEADGLDSVICLETGVYFSDDVFGYMYQTVGGGAVFSPQWCSQ